MILRSRIGLIVGVVAAVALRVAVMAVTYHPDVRATAFASFQIVERGKVANLYDLLYAPPKNDPFYDIYRNLGTQELNSPPLAYFVPAGFRLVLRPFIDKTMDVIIFEQHESQLFKNPGFMLYLVLIKMQNLVADLVLAWLLTFFFKRVEDKWKVFWLWMINPITLYATFAMGQRDIWPTMLSVAAGVFLVRKKPYWAAVMLGLGGSYKVFPLLFLIPVGLSLGKTVSERVRIIGAGLVVYLATILPYALFSRGYRVMALFAPQTDKVLFARFNVSGDQFVSLFVFGFVVFSGLSFLSKRVSWVAVWTGILLLLYSVTNYHPQWFLWVTPWLAIFWLKERSLRWLIVFLILADFGIVMSFDASLHYGLFGPILPVVREIPYTLPGFISKFMPFAVVVSMVRSFLAGVSVVFIWRTFSSRPVEEL